MFVFAYRQSTYSPVGFLQKRENLLESERERRPRASRNSHSLPTRTHLDYYYPSVGEERAATPLFYITPVDR